MVNFFLSCYRRAHKLRPIFLTLRFLIARDPVHLIYQFDATANGTSTPSARMPPTGALPASPPRALANGKAASSQKADSPAEQLFLLDISPSSRAVAILINMMPAASRVQVHVVASIADLPDPVQKGCAKLPLLLSAGTGFELWDAHAIMGYLADKYASPGRVPPSFSFPSDIEGRAKLQQFLAYRQATLWPAVRDHVFAQLFPASPVCPVSRGPALREYVENAERRLQMELNRLNTVFLDSTPFLASATPSAADVSCACAISLLDWVSNPRIEHYPNVAAWYLAITNLPGYKEVSQAHKRFAATPNNVQQGHFALALIE
ncbi:glutathione S-transferase [Pavlovales sp. CCMP2436]|nr:glutathione S-transferase [Pavlovales sp. CCMP2436]